jgi:hypothetical protein
MGVFNHFVEGAFYTSDTGERLFCPGWPSPIFIIPDAETEQRLFRKHVWRLRVFFLGSILVTFLFAAWDLEGVLDPYWFMAYCISIYAFWWITDRIMVGRDLRGLRQPPGLFGPHSFSARMARRHSKSVLLLQLILSLLCVAIGVWMLGFNWGLAIFQMGAFTFLAIGWSYALVLKAQTGVPPGPDEIERA